MGAFLVSGTGYSTVSDSARERATAIVAANVKAAFLIGQDVAAKAFRMFIELGVADKTDDTGAREAPGAQAERHSHRDRQAVAERSAADLERIYRTAGP